MAIAKEVGAVVNFSPQGSPIPRWSKLEKELLFGSTEEVGGKNVPITDLFNRADKLIPDPDIREAVRRHLLKVTSEGETVEQARKSRKGACKKGIVYALDPLEQVKLKTAEGIGILVEASEVDEEGYAVPEWRIRAIDFQGEPLPDQSLLDGIPVVHPRIYMKKREDGSRVLTMRKAA